MYYNDQEEIALYHAILVYIYYVHALFPCLLIHINKKNPNNFKTKHSNNIIYFRVEYFNTLYLLLVNCNDTCSTYAWLNRKNVV